MQVNMEAVIEEQTPAGGAPGTVGGHGLVGGPPGPQGPVTEVASTPVSTSTALVPKQDMAPATYTESDDAEGEFNSDDIERPTMQIVAKVGELSNTFSPGDILLNKEFVIGGIKAPVQLIACGIRKRYQNDLDVDGGEMGDVVDKATEVVERGGVFGYRPYNDKEATQYWKPILQTLLLIKKPDNLPPAAAALFMFNLDGADYAFVGYTARAKTAYNGIAKPLIGAKKSKGTVRGSLWNLSTKGESYENKSWIQPLLRVFGPTSDAILKFIAENDK